MKKLMSIFLLLTAIPVLAESVGKVLFTANEVLLSRGGAQNKLGRGDSLLAGDTVITAANSSARIKYLNGTLVTVGENSNYKILSYYPKQGEIELTAELKTGKLESETIGRRKKKEELKTPAVVMRIYGTKYKAFVPNPTTTNALVESGEVRVGDMTLNAGQSSVSTPAGTQAAPFPAAGNISTSETTPRVDGSKSDSGSKNAGADGASLSSFVNTTVIVSTATSGNDAASLVPELMPDIAPFVISSCGG